MTSRPSLVIAARVERAAGAVLAREGRLTYPELLIEMGILDRRDLEAWRAGRVPFLELVIRSNLTKLTRIQKAVRRFARARRLHRSSSRPPGGRRFSKTGSPFVEEEYACMYFPEQGGERGSAGCES